MARSQAGQSTPIPDLDFPVSMSEVMVEEIMVPHPICFKTHQTVKEAARLMIEKDISGGPVVDSDGLLQGFLSEDDLMWKGAGVPMDHFLVPPIFIGAFDLYFFLKDNNAVEQELKKILARKVGEAMTKEVVSVSNGVSMSEVSKIMLKHRLKCLPVVEGKKVVGIVTRHDVLRALIASHSPLLE